MPPALHLPSSTPHLTDPAASFFISTRNSIRWRIWLPPRSPVAISAGSRANNHRPSLISHASFEVTTVRLTRQISLTGCPIAFSSQEIIPTFLRSSSYRRNSVHPPHPEQTR